MVWSQVLYYVWYDTRIYVGALERMHKALGTLSRPHDMKRFCLGKKDPDAVTRLGTRVYVYYITSVQAADIVSPLFARNYYESRFKVKAHLNKV